MAVKSFKVDDAGLAELANDPGVRAHLRGLADRAVEFAQSLAPVRTGAYRDSIEVYEGPNDEGRQVVGLGSTSPIWHLIEFGTARNPPLGVLRNAAFSVSDRVEMR